MEYKGKIREIIRGELDCEYLCIVPLDQKELPRGIKSLLWISILISIGSLFLGKWYPLFGKIGIIAILTFIGFMIYGMYIQRNKPYPSFNSSIKVMKPHDFKVGDEVIVSLDVKKVEAHVLPVN